MPNPDQGSSAARPWRADFRDVSELPIDRLVRRGFFLNLIAGTVAVALITFFIYQVYVVQSNRNHLAQLEQRITESLSAHDQVRQEHQAFALEISRITEVERFVGNALYPSLLMDFLGQTLPKPMLLDMVDYRDGVLYLRGRIFEESARASRLISSYMEELRHEPMIEGFFENVSLTGLTRSEADGFLSYEITLRPPPN